MRLSEIHAFNQMIQPYFAPPISLKLPELLTPHDFETVIKGVPVVVSYNTRWDRLDCIDEIVYQSVKVFVAGIDITPMLPNETVNGLRHQVEADWERIGEEAQEDYQ